VGSVLHYHVFRVETAAPGPPTEVTGSPVLAPTTTLVDPEELPNNVEFTYYVVATLVHDHDDNPLTPPQLVDSGPSNFATITAVNDPPTPNADSSYTTFAGTQLVVNGVLANDTYSADSAPPTTVLRAVLDAGPSNGTLSCPTDATLALCNDGSFTYTPKLGFIGEDTFTYRAYEWVPDWLPLLAPVEPRRLSPDSLALAPATVTIKVEGYGFVPVLNLPPPSTKTFKIGSAVPLKWKFTVDGIVYNSVSANPQITILDPTGVVVYQGDPQDPGSSSFQSPTAANGYTWQFNWQTKGLQAVTYRVYVGSKQTGQIFNVNPLLNKAFGPFSVKLKL
jgi:hypothetical protein